MDMRPLMVLYGAIESSVKKVAFGEGRILHYHNFIAKKTCKGHARVFGITN